MCRHQTIHRGVIAYVSVVLTALIVSAFSAGGNAQAKEISIDSFRLDGSMLLKGFTSSKSVQNVFGVPFERPPHATSNLNARYFHGSSELRYSVLLFPDHNALVLWDKQMSNSAPGWISPLNSSKDKQGVQQVSLAGRVQTPRSIALVVNRVLIAVYPYQHGTKAKGGLPEKEFVQLVENVKAELIARAKKLPANRD